MKSEVQLIIMRGLPASGKTTWAKEWVKEDPGNRVRVNRDDLRAMMHDGVFIKGITEQTVIKMRDKMLDEALCSGVSVVNDDTNLNSKNMKELMRIAHRCNAEVVVIDLTNVTPEECQKRNLRRKESGERGVPDSVIWDMHHRYVYRKSFPLPVPETTFQHDEFKMQPYVPDPTLPRAVIFDIDGTLAHMNGRSPYDYTKVDTDTIDEQIVEILGFYQQQGYRILVVSGRKSECREDTLEWLWFNLGLDLEANDYELFMRASGDNRNDALIKYEIYDEKIRPRFDVRVVYDDRNRVVQMWRSIGLKCLQVADGDF